MARQPSFKSTLAELNREFSRRRINTDAIGFYDDPNFVLEETKSPSYLENYASYVQVQNYSDEYIKKAKAEIPFIAQLLNSELVKDGRLGACIDISQVFGRILEKEGFWNYLVKGSLTIKFPKEARFKDRYFWSVDTTDFAAGHAWVVAPPFTILDLSIRQQPFSNGEKNWFPEYIVNSNFKACKTQEEDIISPEARIIMRRQGRRGALLPYIKENFQDFAKTFKPNLVEVNNLRLKYTPIAISAAEEPLERITSLKLSGRIGIEIYNEIIKPKLVILRNRSPLAL